MGLAVPETCKCPETDFCRIFTERDTKMSQKHNAMKKSVITLAVFVVCTFAHMQAQSKLVRVIEYQTTVLDKSLRPVRRTFNFYGADAYIDSAYTQAINVNHNAWNTIKRNRWVNQADGRPVREFSETFQPYFNRWSYGRVSMEYAYPVSYIGGQYSKFFAEIKLPYSNTWMTNAIIENVANTAEGISGTLLRRKSIIYSLIERAGYKSESFREHKYVPSAYGPVLQEIIAYSLDTMVNKFYPSTREVYLYNDPSSTRPDTVYLYGRGDCDSVLNTRAARRTMYAYDGNDYTQLLQDWKDSTWYNSIKYIYKFNEAKQIASFTNQQWEPKLGIFMTTSQSKYTYNADNTLQKLEVLRPVNAGNPTSAMYVYAAVEYEYETTTSVKQPVPNIEVSVFPNPTSDQVQVTIQTEDEKICQLRLFDTQGRLVAHAQSERRHAIFSLTDHPAGVYLLHIEQAGRFVATFTIVRL